MSLGFLVRLNRWQAVKKCIAGFPDLFPDNITLIETKDQEGLLIYPPDRVFMVQYHSEVG